NRPGGDEPGGRHDGAFVQDYECVAGSGDLDECNGRFCLTPEFPEGTYAYFLTDEWPVIPRAFRGSPVSLRAEGPPGGFGGPGGPEGRGPRGPGGPGGPGGPPPREGRPPRRD
ncbi:MAG: YHYH protein, partial [Verrucomicrobia bacterium]|nr:YHYH protein [Verrucomicrobiota bacterium]